jgi:glutamate synthase (NADPH/NADH) large chain
VATLQKAVRAEDAPSYEAFARLVNDQNRQPMTLRGLWDLVAAGPPVPIDEVEPATAIVKRFATGAMSFGSISKEAHENLAVAMNRIGGRSNTGEGGERFLPMQRRSRRSSVKQVASARFGVTAEYLVNADDCEKYLRGQAGRRRTTPGAQGGQGHRRGALLDARRDLDFAAAPS